MRASCVKLAALRGGGSSSVSSASQNQELNSFINALNADKPSNSTNFATVQRDEGITEAFGNRVLEREKDSEMLVSFRVCVYCVRGIRIGCGTFLSEASLSLINAAKASRLCLDIKYNLSRFMTLA